MFVRAWATLPLLAALAGACASRGVREATRSERSSPGGNAAMPTGEGGVRLAPRPGAASEASSATPGSPAGAAQTCADAAPPGPARWTDEVVEELASGDSHVCARTRLGHVYCWGSNA